MRRPSLRTVRADLPHTALRSVVLPPRGMADQHPGRGQEPDLDAATGITRSFQLSETASMKHSSTGARHPVICSGCASSGVARLGTVPSVAICSSITSSTFLHPFALPVLHRFLRSYGCSDSSTAGQGHSTSSTHTFLSSIEVSQFHVLNLPNIPSSATPCLPSIALSRYPAAWTASPCGGLGFATGQQARQDIRP